MRIICSQCQTRFRVADKYLTERSVRVQCPRCKHVRLIQPKSDESLPWPEESAAEVGLLTEASPLASEEVSPEQQDADLDFSDLRSELKEEAAAQVFEKSSLEDWELQPTQTIIGSSVVFCQSCGRVLVDSFDQALEICESCRNLPLRPKQPSPPRVDTASREEVKSITTDEMATPYVVAEPPLPPLEEIEGLATQYTPPYAFEGPHAPSQALGLQKAAVSAALPLRRGVWFWLCWVLIGCGTVIFFILLFLVIFVVR
ncbi:MAG: zinc-ribbon domain-containing protein [Cystobacterineae bacterium]|nr:zinc-ribbon domain-containing protein [Cystobacterineae bacterium]